MSQEYRFVAEMILGLSTTISRLLPPCCGVVKINCSRYVPMLSSLSDCSGFLYLFRRAFSFLMAYVQICSSSKTVFLLLVGGPRT
jgi:hypothetical protein